MTRALRRPNLFIIGAMKPGTTSPHEYLDTHPQIAMSETKEPGYFAEELSLDKGECSYLSLFAQDERIVFRGESSSHYTKLPLYRSVAERLHRFCPDARLIYIMRDPFDQATESQIPELRRELEELLHGNIEDLSQVLGRDFPKRKSEKPAPSVSQPNAR
ncbi:MAG: sulfotransferase [Acidobacteriota bacterium]|nr:sulfotransferase [Acidobacteriota bacterium]